MATIPPFYISDSVFNFPNGHGQIRYTTENKITLWNEVTPAAPPLVHLTTLEVVSGGGKTTLMNLIYNFLLGKQTDLKIHFLFSDDPTHKNNVVYIPQKPNNVLHWKVKSLVPKDSKYISCMFDEVPSNFDDRMLSSCSGGQLARILVASALHRLNFHIQTSNYILLDEAFEGIDLNLLARSMNGISQAWSTLNPGKYLFMLLVTHLDVTKVISILDKTAINLSRILLKPGPSVLKDKEQFEIIPVTLRTGAS